MYMPNNRANFVRQKMMKLPEIDEYTSIVRDFNTSLSEMDKFFRQKNQ